MPIDYSQYHPKWSLISRLIRFRRAGNRCEECGVANYTLRRVNKETNQDELPGGNLYLDNAAHNGFGSYKEAKEVADHWNEWCADGLGKWTVIVLTVSHLDHDKTNNRFHNLKALCQRCHLKHDQGHHIENRKYGRYFRINQLQIFN